MAEMQTSGLWNSSPTNKFCFTKVFCNSLELFTPSAACNCNILDVPVISSSRIGTLGVYIIFQLSFGLNVALPIGALNKFYFIIRSVNLNMNRKFYFTKSL